MSLRVDVVADLDDSDPGFVGERLVDKHGAELVFHDRDDLRPGKVSGSGLVLLLGSGRSAHAPGESAVVAAESGLIRSALDSGVPVIGICYGAQLLAHALGGTVAASPAPEIGWYELSSNDLVLCPPGPWTQFHSDAFTAPPRSRVLGSSSAGCQGFADESRAARALCWQFHPEVTPARFTTWVERLRTYCTRHGADPDQLIADARRDEERLRQAAYELTDAALSWVGVPHRAESGERRRPE